MRHAAWIASALIALASSAVKGSHNQNSAQSAC